MFVGVEWAELVNYFQSDLIGQRSHGGYSRYSEPSHMTSIVLGTIVFFSAIILLHGYVCITVKYL